MKAAFTYNPTIRETTMAADNSESIHALIQQLQIEHRDMDDVISLLNEDPHVNQIQLRRLKKRKLLLKDRIEKLRSKLIPDLNA